MTLDCTKTIEVNFFHYARKQILTSYMIQRPRAWMYRSVLGRGSHAAHEKALGQLVLLD